MSLIVAAENVSTGISGTFELGSDLAELGSEFVGMSSLFELGAGGVMYCVMKSSIDSALVRSTSGKPA